MSDNYVGRERQLVKIIEIERANGREAWARVHEHLAECDKLRGQVRLLEEECWDSLCQGAYVNGDTLDNMCMSTWESLSAYFAAKGWLEGESGRIYRIVPVEERPK